MMKVIPFKAEHLKGLVVHQWIGHINNFLTEEYGKALEKYPSYSGVMNNDIVACAGIFPLSNKRYVGWALMTDKTSKYMLQLTREIKDFLELFKGERIEIVVRHDFNAGLRWAGLLGFNLETPKPMSKYGDDGFDYYQFSMVK